MASTFIGGGLWVPTNESSAPHNSVSEIPAPVAALQPPASNSGSDDPTGGMSKEAGGLSSTAGIGSPVTAEAEQQTMVGSVLEYAFGKKERTAEEVEAAAPTSSSVTAGANSSATNDSSSGTYLGAMAAAGGAAVASLIPGLASATGSEPHAATSSPEATTTKDPVSGSSDIGAIGGSTEAPSSTAATPATTSTATEPVVASSTPADVKSSTAITEDKSMTAATDDKSTAAAIGDKTLGEKAADATETVKASANEAAASAADTAKAAEKSAKEAVSGEKKEEGTDESDKPKKVSDHEAAIRENKESIPTAGGEKLGAAHAGESKVIPDVPKQPAADETANVSSSAGQPDTTTADNTAKNAGPVNNTSLPPVSGKKTGTEGSSDKPKFMDRLKNKLHIGDKKDKA